MSWHRFELTSDDDNECATCGVVVDEQALNLVTILCPAPPCTDPSNHGEPCVFVPAERGAECAYCARPADPDGAAEDDDVDLDKLLEDFSDEALTPEEAAAFMG